MKSKFIKVIISLIFLIIFNVIFFIGGIVRSEANWCSYGFVTVAYILLLCTPLFAKGGSSAVLEGSLWLRATFFFFTELIIGIICMIINPDSMQWPMIIQGCLLAVFLILQLMSVLANDSTTAALQQQKEESFARQILIDQLQMKSRIMTDMMAKSSVNRCLDALGNCPIQTCDEALDADLALSNAVNVLCSTIENGNSSQIKDECGKVLRAIQERNLIIKRSRIN